MDMVQSMRCKLYMWCKLCPASCMVTTMWDGPSGQAMWRKLSWAAYLMQCHGVVYVVQPTWCKLRGASYVVQAIWCRLCGANYVVQYVRCKLCGASMWYNVRDFFYVVRGASNVVQATSCNISLKWCSLCVASYTVQAT